MKRLPRYTVMSVPGDADDGSDTWWFVFDRRTRKSVEIGATETAHAIAIVECRRRNRTKVRR